MDAMETAPAIATDATEASGEQLEVPTHASQASAEESIASRNHETEGPLLATDLGLSQGTQEGRRPRKSLVAWAGALLVVVALVAASSAAALHWGTFWAAAKGKQQAGFLHRSDDMGAASAKIALPDHGWPAVGKDIDAAEEESLRGDGKGQDRDGLIVKLPGSGDERAVPAQCGFMEDSVEYPGNDLELAKPVAHAEACCQRCTAHKDCIAWSFMKPTTACYLKGGKPRPAVTRIFNVQSVSGMPTQVSRSIPRIQRSAGLSLLCVSLVLPWGYEHGLLQLQYTKGASIFACDEYAVYSNVSFEIAPAVVTGVVHTDLFCPQGGKFMTVLNTPVFLKVWAKVIEDGRFRFHDWTLKVDPDAVFFPPRLRHLTKMHPESQQGVYLNNCHFGLHGPVEVFSRDAVLAFALGRDRCRRHFDKVCKGPCQFGEDMYMDRCLNEVLKVRREHEYSLLLEDHCDPPSGWDSCNNATVAAFHPFKNKTGYEDCWERGNFLDMQKRNAGTLTFK